MDKTYNPADIEKTSYPKWEKNGYFSPQGTGTPYSIMIPPPNVTGSLHMGHAFQHTLQDALIRHARMQGKNALWQVGTDHAGIATQMVVERKLAQEGQAGRVELGREAFIEKIWQWKEHSGGTITRQMRRLGNSVDWQNERFTMDDGFYQAVQEAFIRLFDDKLIYRSKRLVNWDPKLHTAISDLEVENKEEKGFLWHFRYPLADGAKTQDGKNYIVVATTRPETMLGDTAVAVHPEDERYQGLIGQFIDLPLVNQRIAIIGDKYVDKDFGTGCVKITPAHDFNDYEVGKRNQLLMINVLDKNAAIAPLGEAYTADGKAAPEHNRSLPEAYIGLDRYHARKAIVSAFEAAGLLEKIDDHLLKVPTGDRSGLVIEPLLTDQWFVDAKTLAKPAIEAVEDGRIQFVPKQYENMYFSWMRDIQDWCISRQLWWGHRIPAWYDKDGNIYVGRNEEDVRAKYQLAATVELEQDADVLDTWFSSALWSFGTLGWPENTQRLALFHPTDVLVTGFDIIFFWVARMIMMTMHLIKDENDQAQIPFKTVYVTGLIRDETGQKMSKSKGNVLDPLDMIDGIELADLLEKRTSNLMQPQMAEKIAKRTSKEFPQGINAHGTDALRFTLAALASTGRDINWDMKRLEGYRNFCNKLWNAARFVLSNTEGHDCGQDNSEDYQLSLADQWIISRLQVAEETVNNAFTNYRFDLVSQALYEFVWHEYCDWYLELVKPVFWDKNSSAAQLKGTRRTLIRVLDALLRLAHPIIPFITEEIWQLIKPLSGQTGDTIMLAAYPAADAQLICPEVETQISLLQALIVAVRNIRGEMNISPAIALPVFIQGITEADKVSLSEQQNLLVKLAKLDSITYLDEADEAPLAATQLVGNIKVLVPLAGLIDKEQEIARLSKNIEKQEKEKEKLAGRLNNANFVNNAPIEVVTQEKAKLAEFEQALLNLQSQLDKIKAL